MSAVRAVTGAVSAVGRGRPVRAPRVRVEGAPLRVDAPAAPALVVGSVTHTRRTPLEHTFTYRHYTWLVDVDALPRFRAPLRWLAAFDPADHLDGGRLGGGLRGDVARFCAARGVTLAPTDRVLMLGHARALGHVFDPMTAFWCLAGDGTVRAVVVEVHNTYGGRHAYLVRPDAAGRAVVAKESYVSPFNAVAGTYRMRLVLAPDRAAVSIRLLARDAVVLDAAVSGTVRAAAPRAVLTTALRHAVMPYRVTALIHLHGVWLWLRGLPVRPGPRGTREVA